MAIDHTKNKSTFFFISSIYKNFQYDNDNDDDISVINEIKLLSYDLV